MNIGVALGVSFSGHKKKRVINDSFNRSDSTTTLGSAETGQVWQALTGTWGVLTGKARVATTSGSRDWAVIDAGTSNASVSASLSSIPSFSHTRLAGRCVDASNLIFVSYDSNLTSLYLYKLVAGVVTAISSTTITLNAGDVVKMRFYGTSIKVYVNGVERLTATETAHQTATKYGIGGHNSLSYRFDDFSIEEL